LEAVMDQGGALQLAHIDQAQQIGDDRLATAIFIGTIWV
jgi:hypothetical protein